MSIFVLDPAGRPLRPVTPQKAAGKVARGDARWLHAPGHEPDRERGTIVMSHDVSSPPADPHTVQIFNADGCRLGSIAPRGDREWGDWLRRSLVFARAEVVGTYSVVLLAPADIHLVRQLTEIELRRMWRRLLDRDRVITETLRLAHRGRGMPPEEALERAIVAELAPRLARLALAEVREMRARMERLDLAQARDTEPIRRGLRSYTGAVAREPENGGATSADFPDRLG